MTQEYQTNILTQLVETVSEQQGVNEPRFHNGSGSLTNLLTYIANNGHSGNLVLQFYVSRNDYFILFYNEYNSSYSWISSFVVIADQSLKPVSIINSYYSGTRFTAFSQTITNDTGEGRIYFTNLQNRLYYVNDPTSKKPAQPYEMRILASYEMQLPGDSLLSFKKNADGGNFAFATKQLSNNHLFLTEFVNNVGMPSEWNVYEYNYNELYFSSSLDFYPLWNDTFSCEVVYNTSIESGGTVRSVVKVLKTRDVDSVKSLVLDNTIDTELSLTTEQATLISYTKFAYITSDQSSHRYLHIIDLDDAVDTVIKDFVNGSPQLKVVNNILFIKNITKGSSTSALYMGMIHEGEYFDILVAGITDSGNPTIPFFILNKYNLYTFIFWYGINVIKTYLVYNINNYNGLPFTSKNSTVANSCILYDAENTPIFARNLYNKTIVNNTEIDTVNVSNLDLNDTIISKENVLSINNNITVSEEKDITKNQYENLFINFFNTINITDNNTNENIKMEQAASNFVRGINSDNYINSQARKYKVSYTDGTTYIGTINDVSVSGRNATLVFMINTKTGVEKVEIISNDETVVFATIPPQTYTNNSFYKITQPIIIQ